MNIVSIFENFHVRSASVLLVLLLLFDLLFVSLSLINYFKHLESSKLNIINEAGYAEVYQHIKFLLVIVLLIYIALKNASARYLTWAGVFTYFLLDDFLQIHERFGNKIASSITFIPPLGISHQAFGELVISLIAFLIMFAVLVQAYRGSGSTTFKKISLDMALLIIVLAFFGVFIDVANTAIKIGWKTRFLLWYVEEGGELVTVSFILWYIFLVAIRDNQTGNYIYDYLRCKKLTHKTT